MIQPVADDGVLLVEECLEQSGVGVETRGIQNRVLSLQKFGDFLFKRLVDFAGATDETHRRHAVTVLIQRFLARRNQVPVIGETQIIVGTKVEYLTSSGFNVRLLGRQKNPLLLIKTRRTNLLQLILGNIVLSQQAFKPLFDF